MSDRDKKYTNPIYDLAPTGDGGFVGHGSNFMNVLDKNGLLLLTAFRDNKYAGSTKNRQDGRVLTGLVNYPFKGLNISGLFKQTVNKDGNTKFVSTLPNYVPGYNNAHGSAESFSGTSATVPFNMWSTTAETNQKSMPYAYEDYFRGNLKAGNNVQFTLTAKDAYNSTGKKIVNKFYSPDSLTVMSNVNGKYGKFTMPLKDSFNAFKSNYDSGIYNRGITNQDIADFNFYGKYINK